MTEGQVVSNRLSHHREEIDGLRALAILPVILFHAGFPVFSGGFVGVDVFFVISGYLITSIILSEKSAGTFSLWKFYERRARRLLPALFLVLYVSIPLAWVCLLPADFKNFSLSLIAVTAFASNFLFWWWSGYFDTASELKPLLHTWSLGVEGQYYLLFPIFLILTWRFGRRRILITLMSLAIASLLVAQWASVDRPFFTFFLLPTRGFELLIGAGVAFLLENKHSIPNPSANPSATLSQNSDAVSTPESRKSYRSFRVLDQILEWIPDFKHRNAFAEIVPTIGLALVVAPIFAFDKQTPFPSIYALIPTVGTAILIVFATQKVLVGRVLASRPLVGVGLISYSAYLWHQPLFAFAKQRSAERPDQTILALISVFAIVLSYFSWKYIERPFRSERRFSRGQICRWGFAGGMVLFVIGAVGYWWAGFPDRFPGDDRQLAALDTIQMGRYTDKRFTAALDRPFDASGKKRVLIIGDSFAKDLVNAIYESGLSEKIQLSTHFISSDCGNLYLQREISTFIQPAKLALCKRAGWYESEKLKRLLNGTDEIWLSSAWSFWVAAFLPESIGNLKRDFGKEVLVFGSKNFGEVTAKGLLKIPATSRLDAKNPIRQDVVLVNGLMRAMFPNSAFIDITAMMCANDMQCRLFDPEGELLSYDGAHLTPPGARYLGRHLTEQSRLR